MLRNTFFISPVVLFALCLLLPSTSRAEDTPIIIDGVPDEWSASNDYDSLDDVAPEQVNAIDLGLIRYLRAPFRASEQAGSEEGFLFLINFGQAYPTPFAGPEERSLEIFFDTLAKAGDPTTVWKDTPYAVMAKYVTFAPDQRARVTWKEGEIVELAFAVWDGSAWETEHVGSSIPEVEAGIDQWWMEVAVRWPHITPQRYTEGKEDYTPFAVALCTTQGEAHDYFPNPGTSWHSQYATDWTAMRAV
jgi:hypothetical protein